MSNKGLKEHYERKYSFESTGLLNNPIVDITIPGNRFEAVIKYFPQHFHGGEIIEFGAGNGIVAKTLLESNKQISSYSIGDISLPRIEGIKKNLHDKRLQIKELDVENIPEDLYGKFDAVIMMALIEHLIDPLRAMQNIRKLLKPTGFVYVDTPNIAKYTRRIKLLFGRFPSTASVNEGLTMYSGQLVDLFDEGHLHYFTYRSLSMMLLTRCGFSKIQKVSYPISTSNMGRRFWGFLARLYPELFSELAIFAFA